MKKIAAGSREPAISVKRTTEGGSARIRRQSARAFAATRRSVIDLRALF
jgi:hypothetical protein